MTYQTGKNIGVVLVPTTKGVVPARNASTAMGIRFNPSPGLRLAKALVQNQEVRRDGQRSRDRHGTGSVPPGTYVMNLMVGDAEPLLEAVARGTWVPDQVLDNVSVTVTSDTIVRAAGSWLTAGTGGIRRGMMVQLRESTQTANNGRWLRVTAVTASTLTVAAEPELTAIAVAEPIDVAIAAYLVNGNPPVERYFVGEQADLDIDESILSLDLKVTQVQIELTPDANVLATFTLAGLNQRRHTGAESPYFTAPVYSVSLPLSVADAKMRVLGEDYADLASFTFTWDLGSATPSVIGPTAPDVFLNNGTLSGSITAMRKDGTFFQAFKDETRVEIMAVFVDENGNDFLSLFIGNAVFGTPDAPIGGDGAVNESIPFTAGADDGGGDRARTSFLISTSASMA